MNTSITKETLKSTLTEKEFEMLENIVDAYNINNNVCFMTKTTNSEKGLITQLQNKGLIYDSFNGMHNEYGYESSNWFPIYEVLDAYELEHY